MMLKKAAELISRKLSISENQVISVLDLYKGGATIPFISRYRKEKTGGLDEVVIENIIKSFEDFEELSKRKKTIIDSIESQGLMTPQLNNQIEICDDKRVLEDIYLPFKPKKLTKAEKARKLGLEPLARILMQQSTFNFEEEVNHCRKNNLTFEEAVDGAIDIVAEWMSEHKSCRQKLRNKFIHESLIVAKKNAKVEDKEGKFLDYYDWSERLKKCPPHRFLALYRGEKEEVLKVKISLEKEVALDVLKDFFLKDNFSTVEAILKAISEAWKRLLEPGLQTETFQWFKEMADVESIAVFSNNLKQLLMAPPLGNKTVLALDPGYRSGCKVVCLSKKGNLVHNETIFPHPPQNEKSKAASKIATLCDAYKIEAIAIGNGTAGRETEHFIKGIRFKNDVQVFVVNEDGASIYSASPIARKEFPDYDVTVRGAVSIGRRLMDPLAELVKIDPKSLGIGQYQHDVDHKKIKKELDRVVSSAVNAVGVNVNIASASLLSYVSGIGEGLAEKIVAHRDEKGAFKSREDLKNVSGMGEKSFEQCAGFLRVPDSVHPLDNSAVHPERYFIAEKMANQLQTEIKELIGNHQKVDQIKWQDYQNDEVGVYTLKDLISELKKPTRDIRSKIKEFEFSNKIHSLNDLEVGMIVPGIITNVTHFGAFVDIGIKENGLIHISQLKQGFVSNPSEVVKLNQQLEVKVVSVDKERKRLGCSLIFD